LFSRILPKRLNPERREPAELGSLAVLLVVALYDCSAADIVDRENYKMEVEFKVQGTTGLSLPGDDVISGLA